MKNRIVGLLLLVLFSCSEPSVKKASGVVPGTYVREVKNEMSTGHDTLILTGNGPSPYTIKYHLTYQRIKDGRLLPPERKEERWIAIYDEKSGLLVEQKRGRVLSFQPDKATLMVGSSSYKKISSF